MRFLPGCKDEVDPVDAQLSDKLRVLRGRCLSPAGKQSQLVFICSVALEEQKGLDEGGVRHF